MGFPVVYLFAAAILFDIPVSKCVQMILSPSYYLLSILAVLSGYGLWEVRPWGWYVFLVTNILVVYSNAVMATHYAESHHTVLSFIFSMTLVIGLLFKIGREICVPYFLPKIRWWESNPRYKLSVPAKFKSAKTNAFGEGDILDISLDGCFIKTRTDIPLHEPLSMNFTMFNISVACPGIIVWRTGSTVTHPRGIGIKFAPVPRVQRRSLRMVVRHLGRITSLHRSRYIMGQEEFARRMDALMSTKLDQPV